MSEIRTAIRKVWRDLWLHKGRTLLVVMSITAGVLAIGMITTSNTLLQEQLAASNTASIPSHGRISFNRPINLEELESIEDLPGIVVADGRLSYNIQWRRSAQEPWQEATLQALSDYNNQKLDLVELYEGSWCPN